MGVEPYQHPDRNEATHLSLDLDHFSALVIYVGLKGLAADPSLWNKYVEGPGYDKLLFRKEDFQAPAASPLFAELYNSPDRDVREAAEQLLNFSRVRMDQVPPLAHLTNSYAKVEPLLLSQQWEAAVQLLNRRGHFRDAPPHLKPLIDQAYEYVCRQEAWARFQTIPLDLSEASDRELLGAWNESVFRGFEPAEGFRPRVVAARKQVEIVERLRLLVQQATATTSLSRERGIAAAAAPLPQGYQYSLHTRVQQARQRVEAVESMDHAIRQADDDEPIVAAWQQACQIRCEGLIPRDFRPRIDLALKRLPIVRVLRQLPRDLPYDQLDRRLLEIWQEETIGGTPEAEAWRPFYQQSLYRQDLLNRLEQAIGRRDETAIAETIRDPYLKDYPMPSSWTPVIRSARQRIAKMESLEAALKAGDSSKLIPLFDTRILRQYEERFRPFQQLLEAWTRSEVLPADKIGLRPAVGRASLVHLEKADSYRVRWTWPQQRFTNECVLAVCAEPPGPDDDPRQLPALFRMPLDRQNWESGGGSRVIHVKREWGGSVVVVWAVLDLGFRLLFSQPLTLGQLESRRKLFGGQTGPQGSLTDSTATQAVPPLPPEEG